MGETQKRPFHLSFVASLKIDFRGSRVTSDGGLILVRELDERFGPEELIEQHLTDSRRGRDRQFPFADLLRQPVYRRLTGDRSYPSHVSTATWLDGAKTPLEGQDFFGTQTPEFCHHESYMPVARFLRIQVRHRGRKGPRSVDVFRSAIAPWPLVQLEYRHDRKRKPRVCRRRSAGCSSDNAVD